MEGGREGGREEGGREEEEERERGRKRKRGRERGREGEKGRERRDHLQVLMTWKQEGRLAAALTLLCFREGAGVPVRSSPFWRKRTACSRGATVSEAQASVCGRAGRPSASLTRPEGCARLPVLPAPPRAAHVPTKLCSPTDAHLRSRPKPTQPGRVHHTRRRWWVPAAHLPRPPQDAFSVRRPSRPGSKAASPVKSGKRGPTQTDP